MPHPAMTDKPVALAVHQILRDAEAQKQARAEQLPTEFDCIRAIQQAYLRLKDLGWNDACYAPKDGTAFEAIEVGCTKVLECQTLGSSVFAAHGGDWWPSRPFVFRKKPSA